MPTYKLTYFPLTGLAESLRFLLHYGGISFEDNRVPYEQWPAIKSKMPMEQIPILEVDGKVFYQSKAIGRYLAKIVNLYSSDDLEAMEIDAAVDDIDDWRLSSLKFLFEEDPAYKEKLKAQGEEKSLFYLKKFEERVKKNGGYFVGNKLSWADILFATMAELTNLYLKIDDVTQAYPALRKVYDTVRAQPKIKAYLEKRPASVMWF